MPTQPIEAVLNRDVSTLVEKPEIDLSIKLLQEILNFSTIAFVQCLENGSRNENEDIAPFSLFHHMIGLVDGVEVLLANGCFTSAIPLVRSTFEILLELEYILENDENYLDRSLTWLYFYTKNRITSYEMFIPTTNFGRQFEEHRKNDIVGSNLDFSSYAAKAEVQIINLNKVIRRDQFLKISTEIERIKNRKKHEKPRKVNVWHSLFGGPETIELLAIHLKRGAFYDLLYRRWSSISHGQDASEFLGRINPIMQAQQFIRGGEKTELVSYTYSFLMEAMRRMIAKFRPNSMESLRIWYKNEVSDMYRQVFARDIEDNS